MLVSFVLYFLFRIPFIIKEYLKNYKKRSEKGNVKFLSNIQVKRIFYGIGVIPRHWRLF